IAKLDKGKDSEGRNVLHILTHTNSAGSWRCKLLLDGGHYRFEGLARSSGIVPIKDDKKGLGAGLRIHGTAQPRTNSILATATWTKLAYEFDAASPDDEIELVSNCALKKAKSGSTPIRSNLSG